MPRVAKPIRSLLLLLACGLALRPSHGQDAKKSDAHPPDYSGEAFVVEESVSRWSFENDGTGTRELSGRLRIQSDAGVQQFGLLKFPYQKATEELTISYVRVRKPDGTTIQTPLEDVQDMTSEVSQAAPLYSDLREKQLPVKGLSSGDVLEFQYQSRQIKPLTPGQFWIAYQFSRNEIVQMEKVEVSVPRGRAIKVKSPELAPVVSEQGERRVYTWTRSNLERKTTSRFPERRAPSSSSCWGLVPESKRPGSSAAARSSGMPGVRSPKPISRLPSPKVVRRGWCVAASSAATG